MTQKQYLPADWMFTPRLPRGFGRGLGKPIYKGTKRVGQRYMVYDDRGHRFAESWKKGEQS